MLTINKEKSPNAVPIVDINNAHTWIEINKSAVLHNLAQYKKVIGNKFLAPVIKANAYGHGLQQIGAICEQSPDVDWLCITLLSDALTLREQGITKPILVLGPINADLADAAHKNIEFIAYNKQMVEDLNLIGKQHNYTFGIHIKIDTGLSRIGVAVDDAVSFINYCDTLSKIKVSGVCTHLAESNSKDQTFTLQQVDLFKIILDTLHEQSFDIPYIHLANTAATTRLSFDRCNFVRVGIGIYGLWPSEYVKQDTQQKYPWFTLKPCLTWKTRVMEVKEIPDQSYVGYNRTHQVERNTKIAIVPIGYFDGYDMRFSNIARIRIHDTYANIIGRVCMNHTIIDVTYVPDVKIGDEVILLGNYPEISPYYFATLTGNNNVREVLTKIFPHIPRAIIE